MTNPRIRKQQGKRLKDARVAAGYRSARDAALSNGWTESTYRAHEGGSRTIGLDDAERYARRFRTAGVQVSAQKILFGDEDEARPGELELRYVPIMGYVGAGGDISPEYEQVPPDGLEQIELPYGLGFVGDPIAFQIRGESMMPRYNDGDIAVVEREQPFSIDSIIGDEAVVRTDDGRRYLKKIMPGRRPNTFNLVSVNAPTIEGAGIVWASPVRMIIPNVGLRRKVPRVGPGGEGRS